MNEPHVVRRARCHTFALLSLIVALAIRMCDDNRAAAVSGVCRFAPEAPVGSGQLARRPL